MTAEGSMSEGFDAGEVAASLLCTVQNFRGEPEDLKDYFVELLQDAYSDGASNGYEKGYDQGLEDGRAAGLRAGMEKAAGIAEQFGKENREQELRQRKKRNEDVAEILDTAACEAEAIVAAIKEAGNG